MFTIDFIIAYFMIVCYHDFPDLSVICLFSLSLPFRNKNIIWFAKYSKAIVIKSLKLQLIIQQIINFYNLYSSLGAIISAITTSADASHIGSVQWLRPPDPPAM